MKYFFYFPEDIHDHRADDVKQWVASWDKEYLAESPQDAGIIAVAGGDGTMLSAVRAFQKYDKPLFGIGRGTENFLLNSVQKKEDIPWMEPARFQMVHLHLLGVKLCARMG